MRFVLDTSVAVRWFVSQPGSDDAATWLRLFIDDPELFVGPDLLRFELHGALARLQPSRDSEWAPTCFERFDRLGVRMLSPTLDPSPRPPHSPPTFRLCCPLCSPRPH